MEPAQPIDRYLAELYRAESRRVLATLIRLLGDFDLAEEALQDAFAAAGGRRALGGGAAPPPAPGRPAFWRPCPPSWAFSTPRGGPCRLRPRRPSSAGRSRGRPPIRAR